MAKQEKNMNNEFEKKKFGSIKGMLSKNVIKLELSVLLFK